MFIPPWKRSGGNVPYSPPLYPLLYVDQKLFNMLVILYASRTQQENKLTVKKAELCRGQLVNNQKLGSYTNIGVQKRFPAFLISPNAFINNIDHLLRKRWAVKLAVPSPSRDPWQSMFHQPWQTCLNPLLQTHTHLDINVASALTDLFKSFTPYTHTLISMFHQPWQTCINPLLPPPLFKHTCIALCPLNICTVRNRSNITQNMCANKRRV